VSKPLPRILEGFVAETERSLEVVASTETLWLTAPPTSEVRKQLKVPQLEALYESVYLRIFASWENALDDLVIHYMADYSSGEYVPKRVSGKASRTLKAARKELYAGKDYLLWHNPNQVVARVKKVLEGCPVETVVANSSTELGYFAALRHRVAHDSPDTKEKFKTAAMALCGVEHRSVGRMLRSADNTDPLNPRKWLLMIRERLVVLVGEMTP
jgi:hypothetical protein